jgi:hypothetical protein|eukprot:COSAG02_NODE_3047_length_7477_cov_15.840201_5_plen_114_part_00
MVMFLLLVYMLAERTPLEYRLEQIKMKRKDLLHTLTAAEEIHVTMQSYIYLKTTISALTAVLVVGTFLVCNVRLTVRDWQATSAAAVAHHFLIDRVRVLALRIGCVWGVHLLA